MKYVNKEGEFEGNVRNCALEFIALFWRAFPSHGRGRRFNPYSAHQKSSGLLGFAANHQNSSRRFVTQRSANMTAQVGENPGTLIMVRSRCGER
jgi:hypothetical protein